METVGATTRNGAGSGKSLAYVPLEEGKEVTAIPPKVLSEPVVVVRHLTKTFKASGADGETVHALRDVHLAPDCEFLPIRRGEFVCLRGVSGGGKTTLLNIIGTIDTATSGTVEILGDVVNERSPDAYLSDLRLHRIGFVFQSFNLLATMSAFENVELPMAIAGKLSVKERRDRALELLAMVGLQDRVAHLPSELSGGEQQRVAVARALANSPEATVQVMDILLRINLEQKTTCIMVTHNPDVECYADRLLFLADGRFTRQVFNQVQLPLVLEDYQRYLKARDQGGIDEERPARAKAVGNDDDDE
ncbi:hypothetical protein H9P43_005067 [Blastocladiella emersonii ATCC 22665]|nr:hypothetical protein H9P43_005067 [Blastocladiella emersonii ATCC 22665]